MNYIVSLLLLVLIVGCVQNTAENTTIKETPEVQTPAKGTVAITTPENTILSCTDSQIDIRQRGKVTLEYGNGQKESTSDGCVEETELAFKPFKTHYYCEGLEVKSKLYNCGVNSTCVKGMCN